MADEMVIVRTHRRGFAPPVWRMLQALTSDVDSWLELGPGEHHPVVLRSDNAGVLWSSLWPDRPRDRLRLTVEADGNGSLLGWELECPSNDLPDEPGLTQMSHRINRLLNGDLRGHLDTRG